MNISLSTVMPLWDMLSPLSYVSLQGGSGIIFYLLTHCCSSVAAVSEIWDLLYLMLSPSTIQSDFRLREGKYTEGFFQSNTVEKIYLHARLAQLKKINLTLNFLMIRNQFLSASYFSLARNVEHLYWIENTNWLSYSIFWTISGHLWCKPPPFTSCLVTWERQFKIINSFICLSYFLHFH